jgi:6-phosphogluconolactonase
MHVIVHETPEAVAAAAADLIAAEVRSGTQTIGLAGGGTPRATYELLPGLDLDWGNVMLWLGDERWVPPDHPDSNASMVRRAFADEVGAKVAAPDYSLGDPHAAAAAYANTVRPALLTPGLVLLGMGEDGHTASLFPGTDALDVSDRSYVANWVAAKNAWRLTATLPLLWSARRTVFLVTGQSKADVVADVLSGRGDYPAGRVGRGAHNTTWLFDAAAASRLDDPRATHPWSS